MANYKLIIEEEVQSPYWIAFVFSAMPDYLLCHELEKKFGWTFILQKNLQQKVHLPDEYFTIYHAKDDVKYEAISLINIARGAWLALQQERKIKYFDKKQHFDFALKIQGTIPNALLTQVFNEIKKMPEVLAISAFQSHELESAAASLFDFEIQTD